jgi:hypothetical protein
MTDPVALLSEYLRIDTSNPRGNSRADERIPVVGIGEMTQIVYKLIEGGMRRGKIDPHHQRANWDPEPRVAVDQ